MKKLVLLFVVVFLLYASPQLVRSSLWGDSMIGFTTYYHVRMADSLAAGRWYDDLSFGGREYTYPPAFHLLLAASSSLKEFVVPFFGALGVAVAYLLCRALRFTDKESLVASAILAVSPSFIYLSSHVNPRMPALVLLVLGYLLLMDRRKAANVLAGPVLAAVLYLHPLVGAVGMAIGAVLFRSRLREIALPYAIGAGLFAAWFLPFLATHGFPAATPFYGEYLELQRGIQYFLLESGSPADSAISLAILLPVLYATFALKGRENRLLIVWFWLAVVAALLLGNRVNEQLLIPSALLAGRVFVSAWRDFLSRLRLTHIAPQQAWKAFLVAYLVAIMATQLNALVFAMPYPQDTAAMLWLRQNSPAGTTVLTQWYYGHWVTGIAGRKNVMDAYAEYAPDIDARAADTKAILYGSDLNKSLALLRKYDVGYVFLRVDKVDFCSGFAFLTRYPYFEKVFEQVGKDSVFVYRVDYTGSSTPYDLCSDSRIASQ
jgi:asparagine N-glycosylation enzyme membrane subunit Stt3